MLFVFLFCFFARQHESFWDFCSKAYHTETGNSRSVWPSRSWDWQRVLQHNKKPRRRDHALSNGLSSTREIYPSAVKCDREQYKPSGLQADYEPGLVFILPRLRRREIPAASGLFLRCLLCVPATQLCRSHHRPRSTPSQSHDTTTPPRPENTRLAMAFVLRADADHSDRAGAHLKQRLRAAATFAHAVFGVRTPTM